MMKNIFYIIILFCFTELYCQYNSGIVKYGIEYSEMSINKKKVQIKNHEKKLNRLRTN